MRTRPKILIVLDLDYTHFATSNQHGVHWIGDKEDHIRAYQELINKAEAQNIEVIFAVVTSKTHFDDICEEAARSFKSLLQRSNPMMVITADHQEYILVKKFGHHFYECLSDAKTKKPTSKKPLLSHFHIVKDCKVDTLLKLGRAHNIAPQNIIFLDDTDYKLEAARKVGIKTVSFECFNYAPASFFDNKDEVNNQLKRIHAELFNVFDDVMQKVLSNQPFEPTKEVYQQAERTALIQTAPEPAPKASHKFMRLFSCCLRMEENEEDERQRLVHKT